MKPETVTHLLQQEENKRIWTEFFPEEYYDERESNRIVTTIKIANQLQIHPLLMLNSCNIPDQIPLLDTYSDDIDNIKYVFKCSENSCKRCRKLNNTTVTMKESRNSNIMHNKGFFMQSDHIYRPHPYCRCRWVQKEPSFLERVIAKRKLAAQSIEYAVVEVVGPLSLGIGVEVVKIGTMLVTEINIFAYCVRNNIMKYEKIEKVDCDKDYEVLERAFHEADWKGLAKLHNKYVLLLRKAEKNERTNH